MNICLLGATGRVGKIILENAIKHGFNVNALIRDNGKIQLNTDCIHYVVGDVLRSEDLSKAMRGTDVVISCLNTDNKQILSASMPTIISEMKKQHINRIITIGTAGILQSRNDSSLYRFQSSESKRKSTKAAEDHLAAYLLLNESDLDWTIVCPTYLPDGHRVGTYRVQKDILPENSSSISIYDTADFAFHQLFTDEYVRCRVGLTY